MTFELAALPDLSLSGAEPLGPARMQLGEGAGAGEGLLWWFDISGQNLFLHAPAGSGTPEAFDLPFSASAMALTPEGGQVLLTEGGLLRRNPQSGAFSAAARVGPERVGLRSNDARVHPSGSWWVSHCGTAGERGEGSIRCLGPHGVIKVITGLTMPNTICFSPDGTRAFFSDTPTGRLFHCRLDPRNGVPLEEPRRFCTLTGLKPDGAVSDDQGRLWIALWGAGCLLVLEANGSPVGRVPLPVPNVTCPAWAGPGLLLVTSAREGMAEEDLARTATAGAAFLIRVRGSGPFGPRLRL